jgi:DNA-binding MarR family transcriptional regulator
MSGSWDICEAAGEIRRGVVDLHRRLRAERPADGLPLAQLGVLGHLYRRGAMTASELAAAERLRPQSLTRVLADLAAAGLVTRCRSDQDRRRSEIDITRRGREAVLRDVSHWDAWLAAAMERELSPTERAVLGLAAHLLARLAAAG